MIRKTTLEEQILKFFGEFNQGNGNETQEKNGGYLLWINRSKNKIMLCRRENEFFGSIAYLEDIPHFLDKPLKNQFRKKKNKIFNIEKILNIIQKNRDLKIEENKKKLASIFNKNSEEFK
jgi:hypothetical protein